MMARGYWRDNACLQRYVYNVSMCALRIRRFADEFPHTFVRPRTHMMTYQDKATENVCAAAVYKPKILSE